MSGMGLHSGIKRSPVTAGRAASLCITAALCSVVVTASAGGARAADWPLRGSLEPSYARWDGWQFGVQAGLSNMRTDFANSAGSQVAFILRNTIQEAEFSPSSWTTVSPDTTTGQVFGAFLAYNMQWDRLVVGFDMGYKNAANSLNTTAADSISRQFVTSDNFDNQITIDARSSMKLVDYATLRGRAGYAFGNFLPYAAVGAAVGRFNYATTVTVHSAGQPIAPAPGVPFDTTETSSVGKNNSIVGGVAAGLGVDWAITPGMFMRVEWEYVAFSPVNGSRNNINTANLGVGMRF
jgi:opacity protein-like surface antigen